MPWVKLPDGTTAHVRMARRPYKRCQYPGCKAQHTKLCDFPSRPRGKTCDAKFCDKHGVSVGYDKDYCWTHSGIKALQEDPEL